MGVGVSGLASLAWGVRGRHGSTGVEEGERVRVGARAGKPVRLGLGEGRGGWRRRRGSLRPREARGGRRESCRAPRGAPHMLRGRTLSMPRWPMVALFFWVLRGRGGEGSREAWWSGQLPGGGRDSAWGRGRPAGCYRAGATGSRPAATGTQCTAAALAPPSAALPPVARRAVSVPARARSKWRGAQAASAPGHLRCTEQGAMRAGAIDKSC